MPGPGRLFANDEELGKKDDEYRPAVNGKVPATPFSWAQWRLSSPRMRRRRIVVGIMLFIALLLFVKNIPTDLMPMGDRIDRRVPGHTINGHPIPASYAGSYGEAPDGPPPINEDAQDVKRLGQHYYNGQIKWYFLAATLQSTARTMGYRMFNKNVVFAAAGAQSVARLIPMACEMSRWNRNLVHMVVMGRDELTIDEYKEINGVDDTCEIYWHDARPDYAAYSTDERFRLNSHTSLVHVHNFLHPQVYIIDDPKEEEAPFVQGIEKHAVKFGKTVIHLPTNAVQKLMWITRLDSGALGAWHNAYVEILVHAPAESSGSLIRLLRSIQQADYFGYRYPHLTIELPAELDKPTEDFLENFIWPPLNLDGGQHTSQLTLRRRIAVSRLTPTEASIRMIESFYPSRIKHSHVLLLSHQAELSSLYYHYLMYNILEYKYSMYGEGTKEYAQLMGISLALPTRLLDDKTKFEPPSNLYDDASKKEYGDSTPFLWQAPDTHATLYFGDKWREFHSFLSSRLNKATAAIGKVMSPNFPAVAEHLLELMRARNYFILYPHVPDYAIATIHNELFRAPEEYLLNEDQETPEENNIPVDTNEPFLTPILPLSAPPANREDDLANTPLHNLLPADGDLPELTTLPLLSYSGQVTRPSYAQKTAKFYSDDFRTSIGACPFGYEPNIVENSADDLFCYGDKDYVSMVGDGAGSRDGVPVGFGSGRGRDADLDDGLKRDEYGDVMEPDVPEEQRKKMNTEFEKQLRRQSKLNTEKTSARKERISKKEQEGAFEYVDPDAETNTAASSNKGKSESLGKLGGSGLEEEKLKQTSGDEEEKAQALEKDESPSLESEVAAYASNEQEGEEKITNKGAPKEQTKEQDVEPLADSVEKKSKATAKEKAESKKEAILGKPAASREKAKTEVSKAK